jgi:hypothetical protein
MVHGVSEGALVVERGVDDDPRKLADVYWPNTDTSAPPVLNPVLAAGRLSAQAIPQAIPHAVGR